MEESTKMTPAMNKNEDNILRDGKSTLYEIDTAFDYHNCPLSCPDVYSPVCITVNRGHGMYYKFFTFVNHCEGDLYYCKNWREFSPPPDEDELVRSSPLSWSFCAANRLSHHLISE
ncbi:unnamed protein product [Danaus chrysippus]|uniref:(African queen) hypothetical protein n=1 Tax=Danaus chrysippus TaxID=151541 RepID=A0A8J2WAJ7_9NEOP|nr:unnamed protein product [Danaus chrysippus]